eukprot:6197878-Pleurochrysis_carterae.AAC.1
MLCIGHHDGDQDIRPNHMNCNSLALQEPFRTSVIITLRTSVMILPPHVSDDSHRLADTARRKRLLNEGRRLYLSTAHG